jgi:hypothetical protein
METFQESAYRECQPMNEPHKVDEYLSHAHVSNVGAEDLVGFCYLHVLLRR